MCPPLKNAVHNYITLSRKNQHIFFKKQKKVSARGVISAAGVLKRLRLHRI